MLSSVGKFREVLGVVFLGSAACFCGGCSNEPDHVMVISDEVEEKQEEKLSEGQKKVLQNRERPMGVSH